MISKICEICGSPFDTRYPNKLFCGFDCRRESVRRRGLDIAEAKRCKPRDIPFTIHLPMANKQIRACKPCVVCGWAETTDLHHDIGVNYILCPNHHALITRGIKTIQELLEESKSVDRKVINHTMSC